MDKDTYTAVTFLKNFLVKRYGQVALYVQMNRKTFIFNQAIKEQTLPSVDYRLALFFVRITCSIL